MKKHIKNGTKLQIAWFFATAHYILRIDSKSKNRFSTLTTATIESTFTNKLHISLSTVCNDDVIKENDVIGSMQETSSICDIGDVIKNVNHCYSPENDVESVFL